MISIQPHPPQHIDPAPRVLAIVRTCAGECAWAAACIVVALLFVSAFVLMAEPVRANDLGAELASPVNLLRMAVLAAALWLWGYIARAVRGTSPKRVRVDPDWPQRARTRR